MAGVTSYRKMVAWRNGPVESLVDIVGEGLDVLFLGLNPSPVSVKAGHYHQGTRGRQFWRYLEKAHLLPPPPFGRYHDEFLLSHKMGITDIVKVPSPTARLSEADIEYGRSLLEKKILRYRPKVVCAIYKRAMAHLLDRDLRHQWGFLAERIGSSRLFAIPFPPGKYAPGKLLMDQLAELRATL